MCVCVFFPAFMLEILAEEVVKSWMGFFSIVAVVVCLFAAVGNKNGDRGEEKEEKEEEEEQEEQEEEYENMKELKDFKEY